MIGMSPMKGIVFLTSALSTRYSPARKLVSPSFSRMFDEIVRVPNCGCVVPSALPSWFETSTISLSVTSLLWCTRGSTSILMPMSWYWYDVTGDVTPPTPPEPTL